MMDSMKLPVRKYGDPILRKRGARIDEVSPEIRELVASMFETMYEAQGVGLAAQQIGRALQLTVIDVRTVGEDRPSELYVDGEQVEVERLMPLVLINPELKPGSHWASGAEGCLSFPELYGYVSRPDSVQVSATNEKGDRLQFECRGFLARVVQHETDHLHGILFVDRMLLESKREIQGELDELYAATKEELKKETGRRVNA